MPDAQLEPIAPFTALPSPAARPGHAATEDRLVLWRLCRAPDDFVCTTVLTSYGYALAFELSGELIRFELGSDLEQLAQIADRLEASLVARGWRLANEH